MRRARCARRKQSGRCTGSGRLQVMPLVSRIAYLTGILAALGSVASAQGLRTYDIIGDAIPASLTGTAGDATRGRALVVDRSSTCILCHSGPFPEQNFQGDVAPSLAATGSRWSAGQIRLRLVDASRMNAATIMPSYYRIDGLSRVGRAWQGKSILTAEQIEDIVTYLVTLRE